MLSQTRAGAGRIVAAAALLLQLLPSYGQDQSPQPERVLTNIVEVWTLPTAERAKPHRIRAEVTILFSDKFWGNVFGICHNVPVWLPIANSPVSFKAGQRVEFDGVIDPLTQHFDWGKTRVLVLEENVPIKPEAISGSVQDLKLKSGRLVVMDAWLDDLAMASGDPHLRLRILWEGFPATAYVLQDTNASPVAFRAGDRVRIKGVSSPQLAQNALSTLSIWVNGPEDVEVIGSLDTASCFDLPLTRIEDVVPESPDTNLVHVMGTVREHEPGKGLTLWDATGAIRVESLQTQPLSVGDVVEAVGQTSFVGVQTSLHDGLYRPMPPEKVPQQWLPDITRQSALRLAEQVRELGPQEANWHLPVRLRGVVTWANPDLSVAYVQDASGGIEVVKPKWDSKENAKTGMIVLLEGETAEGDFAPVITNAVLQRSSWWSVSPGELLNLDQALTGVHDGRWVQMRGYVRGLAVTNGLLRMDLSTSGGEFKVWTPAASPYNQFNHTIVQVQGVCSAIANARRQLTGIQMWVPNFDYIQVREAAPSDMFAASLRTLGDLRRFSVDNQLDRRVRTRGTVVLQVPGRYLYIQEGADSLVALTQQTGQLEPGDQVEVAGFPDHQDRRFVLREAVFRKLSSGAQPTPIHVSVLHAADPDWNGRLGKAEGRLLNLVRKEGEVRLVIQTGDSIFEATLDRPLDVRNQPDLPVGSRVEVIGVNEVRSEEYGRSRSFLLHLRSWKDVTLLQRPSWWTSAHLMWVILGLIGISAMAMVWSLLISRKNRLLEHAQAELRAAHDQLEERVEQRTRELKKAHREKLEISRQAGMAEMAISVLHNVGNVLNSVNVSITLIRDRLRDSRLANVAKATSLLDENAHRLPEFLTQDAKGKSLVKYLRSLPLAWAEERESMRTEVEHLFKNIEHIKVIVATQQSYAKVGGTSESLDVKEILEDALQISSASLERRQVEITRQYEPVPRVFADRHKVLQILVNLLSNAGHALEAANVGHRRVNLIIVQPAADRVRLRVEDNGTGIAPENLNRIFSHGFSTRSDGHGFGLHSCANAAKEMRGSLRVESEGPGKGAAFTLELPVAPSN